MDTTFVVPSRDLRNHTADVLRRVEAGEELDVYHHNRRVARLIPVREQRRWIPAPDLLRRMAVLGADPTGLSRELRESLADSTDDLRW